MLAPFRLWGICVHCVLATCIIPPIMRQWPLCNACVCMCVCVSLCRWARSGSVLTCPTSSVSTTTRSPPSVTTAAPCCGASWGRACSAKVSSRAVGNLQSQCTWDAFRSAFVFYNLEACAFKVKGCEQRHTNDSISGSWSYKITLSYSEIKHIFTTV